MKLPFRYAHAEIRTQVVVICGPTRFQLDHGSALRRGLESAMLNICLKRSDTHKSECTQRTWLSIRAEYLSGHRIKFNLRLRYLKRKKYHYPNTDGVIILDKTRWVSMTREYKYLRGLSDSQYAHLDIMILQFVCGPGVWMAVLEPAIEIKSLSITCLSCNCICKQQHNK